MATLEKIRSKSVLLVSVIGFALVLFIITLVDNPWAMFQDNTSVARVGGHKISVEEFGRRVEQQSHALQQQGRSDIDNAMLQQQVLQGMVEEALLADELEALGITVTDGELTEAMVGDTPHPYITQWANSLGAPSARELHDMAFNPAQYGIDLEQATQLQQEWINMEHNMEQLLARQKYYNLFAGAITANKLDTRALFDEGADTYTIAYVRKDLSAVPDSAVSVASADIRALYDSQKPMYAIDEETRVVNYINIPVAPSAQDRMDAQQRVEKAIVNLRTQPAMEGVSVDPAFIVDRNQSVASKINPANLRSFVTDSATNAVRLISSTGNVYTIAKNLGRSQMVDSIKVTVAQIAFEGTPDSVLTALASAEDPASVAGVMGVNPDQWVSLVGSNDPEDLKAKLRTEPIGQFFVLQQVDGQALIAKVSERKAPVTVYEYATATYNVEPSQNTYNALQAQLKEFLDTVTTAEAFTMENALRHGLSANNAFVTPSTPSIAGLSDSRDIVRWVMEGKKGAVSPIFSDDRNSRLTAVAIVDVYKDYVPATNPDVNRDLQARALADKKAGKLIADYAGKANDIAGYAAAMGATADTTTVNFGQQFIPGLGMGQAALTASVAAGKKGDLVGPIHSGNSVVVYYVTEIDKTATPFNEEQYRMTFDNYRGAQALGSPMVRRLQGREKVDNRILKFYAR
ncbi:MAG: SurA N-terminal domain-containing protein [Muribaculaceae bacterium]|nr:SurA N-terminal domain-containing protein [Muribaculaceae bacterium]